MWPVSLNSTVTLFLSVEVFLHLGFFYLFLKHLVCDFFLQSQYQCENKGTYLHPGGLIHSGIHILGSAPLFVFLSWYYMKLHPLSLILLGITLALEFLIHYHMDWFKMWYGAKKQYTPQNREFWLWLGVDQFVHYMTYLGMMLIWWWFIVQIVLGIIYSG